MGVLSVHDLPDIVSSRSCLSLQSLNGEEGLWFMEVLCTTPVWEAGGGGAVDWKERTKAAESWRLPKGSLPLVVTHLYLEIFSEIAIPPEVLKAILAAIGDHEIYQSGHLFAVLRLLRHHKQCTRSLDPLCTEFIAKHTRIGETITASQSAPAVGVLPPSKRRRLSEAPRNVHYVSSPTEGELASLDRDLSLQNPHTRAYSDPSIWRRLPFPCLYHSLPSHRFSFSRDLTHNRHVSFEWMGREAFPVLAEIVSKFSKDSISPSAAFLHGTIGIGKSHLLAALAVWLRRQDKIVVYIPDCEDLCQSSVNYMISALLCAFSSQNAVSKQKRAVIRCLAGDEDIIRWCRMQFEEGIYTYFLIDQLNAIEDRGGSPILSSI
ncbi:hypothetical protein B0H17DRAFT_263364 [Mycena rosella]|uniref:Uncharacterized protein n=1 Tax=Mycena rosella TaxID=1033263 RepID=A0AAD7G8K6_MYCRO|nr:hypothetical protein B0H17DRAFT_263364 [Mycena rosella]